MTDIHPTTLGDHIIDVDELVQALLDEGASAPEDYARAMRDAVLMIIARVVR